MLKRIFMMSLFVLVGNLTITPFAYGSDKTDKTENEAKFAEKVKTEIKKLGVGKDSKVKVKLKDGIKLKGYISDIDEDGFSVTDKKGKTTAVAYSNAKQVRGNNLSSKVVISIVIFVAIIAVLVIGAKSAT